MNRMEKGASIWKSQMEEAIRLHQQGVEGDQEAVKRAFQILQDIRSQTRGNHLVNAYLGSVTALLGRDAIDPMERMRRGNEGLRLLDEAVQNDPHCPEIRVLRAHVCYRLPHEYFRRLGTAKEDFTFLVNRYESDPGALSKEMYWNCLYHLGDTCNRLGEKKEAKAVWRKLMALSSDPKYPQLLAGKV